MPTYMHYYYYIGLTDYPAIIKVPMDLGTIKTKIKRRDYKTLYQVAEDVRLIWSNCMTYNADGSDFYKLAESLKKKWEEKYQKLLQDISSSHTTTMSTAAGTKDSMTDAAAVASSASALGGSMHTAASSNTKLSLNDKRNFAKLLYQITKEELGKVLVDVEQRHPAAIKRNATEDEVVLNIDEIPGPLLQELHAFVSS